MTAPTPEKKHLQRATFATSRLLDFASVKELTAQTGHDVDDWPLVILKELLDNALDAAEEAGIAPHTTVTVEKNGITIRDNGPGIPPYGRAPINPASQSPERYNATRRYAFSSAFKIHDLGLRIGDIEGLETEDVVHTASDYAVAANLRENGATEAEIKFLLSKRVELNAFASDELVAFIERKLDALGIKKVVPDDKTLALAAERARAKALINEKIEAIVEEASEQAKQMATITDLAASVRAPRKGSRTVLGCRHRPHRRGGR